MRNAGVMAAGELAGRRQCGIELFPSSWIVAATRSVLDGVAKEPLNSLPTAARGNAPSSPDRLQHPQDMLSRDVGERYVS